MIYGDKINFICEKLNIDRNSLSDRLDSTLLKAIATACGFNESHSDGLYSTFLRNALEAKNVDVSDINNPNLYSSMIDALVCAIDHVPVSYQVLDYLQSSGTQWIDTGLRQEQSWDYEMKVSLTEVDNSLISFIFGSGTTAGGGTGVYFSATSPYKLSIRKGDAYDNLDSVFQTTFVNDPHIIKVEDATLYVDGNSVGSIDYNWTTKDYNMALFARNSSGQNASKKMRLYSFKIINGSEVIHEYIPCRRISDSVLGVFDTVSQQFFTNAGTGSFISEESL